ncbi:hypothetical protein HMPREF9622_00465 [Cutibacterium modestum HL037PA3]|uniref:Uncharacterized protein n=1 Tax=Cutibacterium modestum HL044PA1 TaxID=765109 RepID=A0ABP2K826_9ACTN|nr:hypothetical protein HMPREF9607_00693 [Cutibacterium modestum HL044PA1]EFT16474.1 hypothetical protein HMPREF9622_00465 [Cutibacterium modestum HL037PA3]
MDCDVPRGEACVEAPCLRRRTVSSLGPGVDAMGFPRRIAAG